MRAAVNAFAFRCGVAVIGALPLAAAVAAEPPSAAQDSRRPGGDRWVPSLALTSGLTIHHWKGSVASQICEGCGIPDPLRREVALRTPADGSDLAVTPFVGGDFELMTPELSLPASPRFFAGFGVLPSFGFERSVATEGSPGTLASPLPPGSGSTIPFSEDAVLGQGSETAAQLDTWVLGARAGVAIPFELLGRSLRLKSSLGWIRFEVDAEGSIRDAECRSAPPPPAGNTNCNDQIAPPGNGVLRAIELSGSRTRSFDGVGGGLELELDSARAGPLGLSLFVGAHAYHVLGNRVIAFGDSRSFADAGVPGLGAADTAARFRTEVSPTLFSVALGLRFHWLGADSEP